MATVERPMTQRFDQDDGRPWGFMNGETWVPLPKEPMLLGGLGPPPFDVTLPSGVVRHVVHEPEVTDG